MLDIRKACLDDAFAVYRWRNSDYVRATRLDKDHEDLQKHLLWWSAALEDTKRIMFMLEMNKEIVGHVRFDLSENEAEISIVIDTAYCGLGLGTQGIKLGCQYVFDMYSVAFVNANILTTNKPSIKAFEKAGFKFLSSGLTNQMNEVYNVYVLENIHE